MKKTPFTRLFTIVLLASATLILGCKKEEPNPVSTTTPKGAYDNGVFITCEGAFGSGTGTVSFFNRSNSTVSNDLHQSVNALPLGNIVQSMQVHNSKGYVVVNNANKIEIVNASTFVSGGKISGLSSPRYFAGINASKAYVSQWGSGASDVGVRVVDLNSNSAGALIPTGAGPEKMILVGNFMYVTNSGGFGNDSTITIINTSSDTFVKNLTVGPNPNSIVLDKNGKIWVLCGGIVDFAVPANGTPGKLVRINPSTNTVEASFAFTSGSEHPLNLCTNKLKDKLFFLGNLYSLGNVYSFAIGASTLPTTPILNRNYYGLGIDPTNDQIFTSVTNFSNGMVLRYNSNAMLLDSFQVGVIPGNFCFN
jgi:hypothetical protein